MGGGVYLKLPVRVVLARRSPAPAETPDLDVRCLLSLSIVPHMQPVVCMCVALCGLVWRIVLIRTVVELRCCLRLGNFRKRYSGGPTYAVVPYI